MNAAYRSQMTDGNKARGTPTLCAVGVRYVPQRVYVRYQTDATVRLRQEGRVLGATQHGADELQEPMLESPD